MTTVVKKLANLISPYAKGPHRNEDHAYQTVYNQVLYGWGRPPKRMRRGGAGPIGSVGKQLWEFTKGMNEIMQGAKNFKEPNKALWANYKYAGKHAGAKFKCGECKRTRKHFHDWVIRRGVAKRGTVFG